MCYVVLRATNEILNRCDAWEFNSVEKMRQWAEDHGYFPEEEEITLMGDMVIWCC